MLSLFALMPVMLAVLLPQLYCCTTVVNVHAARGEKGRTMRKFAVCTYSSLQRSGKIVGTFWFCHVIQVSHKIFG